MLSQEDLMRKAENLLSRALTNIYDPNVAPITVANELKAAELCAQFSQNSTYWSLWNLEQVDKMKECAKTQEQANG